MNLTLTYPAVTRLRMAETIQAATKMIEQGHVRVGTETVSKSKSMTASQPMLPGDVTNVDVLQRTRHSWSPGSSKTS